MPELDFASALETNWIKLGTLEMEAAGDRLIVVQDEFRSGYECLTCKARDIRIIDQMHQASVLTCGMCAGLGHQLSSIVEGAKRTCPQCEGRGWHVCPDCQGTGTAGGGIAHSQESERRPSTGTVYSKGSLVTRYERGDGVIYASFSGHFWELEAPDVHGNYVKIIIGILREDEVIARVKGHLELRRVNKSTALHTAA
jgi:hypothetical protein